ncbi:MAG TPA: EthD domain-containing protein [Acidimicrobiales bacterium]|nr:EthD domain-containing protein [Acidimicrobiales bacterium]
MVRLTCLLRRKAGLTPVEFHQHWSTVHGPLIASSQSGSHVVRYEQHPRPLSDYHGDDDPGFDGVTVQWFESMDSYQAHMAEPDFGSIWQDIERFLDTDALHFVLTEHPSVVMGDAGSFPLA